MSCVAVVTNKDINKKMEALDDKGASIDYYINPNFLNSVYDDVKKVWAMENAEQYKKYFPNARFYNVEEKQKQEEQKKPQARGRKK